MKVSGITDSMILEVMSSQIRTKLVLEAEAKQLHDEYNRVVEMITQTYDGAELSLKLYVGTASKPFDPRELSEDVRGYFRQSDNGRWFII